MQKCKSSFWDSKDRNHKKDLRLLKKPFIFTNIKKILRSGSVGIIVAL